MTRAARAAAAALGCFTIRYERGGGSLGPGAAAARTGDEAFPHALPSLADALLAERWREAARWRGRARVG